MISNSHVQTRFFWMVIGLLSIGLIAVSTILYYEQLEISKEKTAGNIIFTDQDPVSGYRYLMIMDGNGNRLQVVPIDDGSKFSPMGGYGWLLPTWSPDGHQIAVLCGGAGNICLIDSNTIPDLRSFPIKDRGATIPVITQELASPEICQGTVKSMSWSSDGSTLVIVCGISTAPQICFLGTNDNASYCWEDNFDQSLGFINAAAWSPNEATIAVEFKKPSDASQIYLMKPSGETIRFLTTGTHPEWSPDGQQLAFFTLDQERQYVGIAMIDANGANQEWLYRPPQRGSEADVEGDKISPGCNVPEGCGHRLAWSPDGQFIAFSSSWTGSNYTQIFRIDIATGEIIFLTNHLSDDYGEPDWGETR
ncbi:MAG TPA: hypothetical protein PLA25_12205 [Anaerolineaceae bacterium]|nr:hypothetical protein [Anaerolineaceae bacterium]